jgi:large subunit ribosomal protein L3
MEKQITGIKIGSAQKFTPKGKRVVVTEVRTDPGQKPGKVFKKGEKVKVTGWAKGKGFAGVIKRWGFKGGPRTHGQSDRERALGSPGAETPGRVLPGKKMPGRLGNQRVTIVGLKIFEIGKKGDFLLVRGVLPGSRGGKIIVRKEKKGNA